MSLNQSSFVITECMKQLMRVEKYWDKWICDKTLFFECLEMYPDLKTLKIESKQFLSTLSKKFGAMSLQRIHDITSLLELYFALQTSANKDLIKVMTSTSEVELRTMTLEVMVEVRPPDLEV